MERGGQPQRTELQKVWFARYDPDVPHGLDYPDATLPEVLRRTAEKYPERKATIFHGRSLTYRRLEQQVEAFATGLRSLGVNRGDRVAVMLPNLPQFVIAFYGGLRAGAIVVPTNPLYTERELEHQLNDAGASAIVTLEQLFGQVQAALPYTGVRLVIVARIVDELPGHVRPMYLAKQRLGGHRRIRSGGIGYRFRDLLHPGPDVHRRDELDGSTRRASPDDVAVLQYTGGTTGVSKGAMLTHRNLIANSMQAHAWQGDQGEREGKILCAVPFFHAYGLSIAMNLAVVGGLTMLPMARWSTKEAAALIAKHRPQLFPGVPTMYLALANRPGLSKQKFSSLEVCISGASALPLEIQERFEEVSGARLVEGYGLTEAGPVTHSNPVRGDRRPGSVGIPFPDTEAMITDPDSWEPLPAGHVGEMTVRGPQVMAGYWKRPAETDEVLRGGWLHTGDLARVDEDGYFRIVDRKKDLIIAGGYNVYPREIEEALFSHPKVEDAAVVGVPNEYRGETVKAFVVLKQGFDATAEEITAYCRETLAVFKVPKIVEFRKSLPRTTIGKVLRRELRAESVADVREETAAS